MKTHRGAKWVVAAAAMVVLAGGLVTGSNMGFKFNALIDTPGGNPAPAGSNRLSFPLNNPYGDSQGVCDQLGLEPVTGTVIDFDPLGGGGFGAFRTHFCGNGLTNFSLVKGRGLFLGDPNGFAGGSAIIVGSHDPTFVYNLEALCTPAPCGNNWISNPYHATTVTAQDVCDDIGLPAGDRVSDFDPNGPGGLGFGSFNTHFCGNGLTDFTLTVGRALLIQSTAATAWIPSHF